MSSHFFQPRFEDLPSVVPVFPLTGALLLPEGHLPLTIFEPRYLAMTLDCLGQGRLFAMGQPRDPTQDPSPLYSVACLGRVVSFVETGDGRLGITLEGVCRLKLLEEKELHRGYRRFAVDYTPFAADMQPAPTAPSPDPDFMPVLKAYAEANGLNLDWKALREIPREALVTSLAMACPFEPSEKQALLEAPTPAERATLLTSLLRIGAASPITGGSRQ
ncbi:LON peptidase substrate-binding domain-containing protein [Pararhodospirillum photometricum]|uniref:Peptidase S16, lon-like n=1 Tax=Pararhodospirillum photometricum DSM 122 TaxID=1150469 RepID=H6SQT8_PARPM|nr:LON peptidase substrate-binding domain-containing protein [Pararhodospirillum photometricum]CCG07403.1 Peptidase S16, lon-like [Pararhodospirillum photometricum DSM 122]